MSAPVLPDVPSVLPELLSFEAGEAVGEVSGSRAERRDLLAYLLRKQANALRVVKTGFDQGDYAQHTARAISVLIDDVRGGLHEGESLSWPTDALMKTGEPPAGVAIGAPYPFRDHRSVAEADADAAARVHGAMTHMGEV